MPVIDDYRLVSADTAVGCIPGVRYCAVWAYGIGSSNAELVVVTIHSREQCCGQVPLSVKNEAADCGEVADTDNASRGLQAVATVQTGVRTDIFAFSNAPATYDSEDRQAGG